MAVQQAPGRLEVLREFVNTYDVENDADELGSLADAMAWFEQAGLTTDSQEATRSPEHDIDLEDIRTVREAFRDLLHAVSHDEDDPDARAVLNRLAYRAGVHVRFDGPKDVGLVPQASGGLGALGRLLAIAFDAMQDGTWERLKVCDNSGCAWAFYDHSRNRSGRWCSMAVCGNRMKVKAFRERTSD